LVLINTVTVRHPVFFCNIDQWMSDWRVVTTPNNLRASYGHDVECAWLVMDALRTMSSPTPILQVWAHNLVDHGMKYGFDTIHGGFFYGGPLGHPADDTKKEWWVQAEALVGLLEVYRMTHDAKYFAAFRQTLDFIEKHQLAPGGGWYATCHADGSLRTNTRSNMWQGPYHTGRSLLQSAKLLEELARSENKN
jgi:cellobiose epimerase